MKLIATQEFPYGGKTLKPSDSFESASDEDARILKGVGKAKDAPVAKPSAQSDATDTRAMKSEEGGTDLLDPPPQSGKRYNRRDMRAKE